MPAAEGLFATGYHQARERFLLALDHFEQRTGRAFVRERCFVDARDDLSIDVAELRPADPQRLYVAIAGIHGIEGFAGGAILQGLLAAVLPGVDFQSCGLLLVHALNPSGMHEQRRVNASNVDLNRNFAAEGSALFATQSPGYARVATLLEPSEPYDERPLAPLRFLAGVGRAVARHGFAPLRQATLAGQYTSAGGLFYGGQELQPETRFFQACFSEVCARYREVLLTDLHTGYGDRAQVSALFARADSPEVEAFTARGVRDQRGRDQAYAAHGDLVAWCHHAAKRTNPGGVFNGVVVELGTRGLGTIAQLQDLYTVVGENQVRHHGARTDAGARAVRRAFNDLFNPQDPVWRTQVITGALDCMESLLTSRNYL
jgi:predicted deacylase